MRVYFKFETSNLIRLLLVFSGGLPWVLIASSFQSQAFYPLFKGVCHQMPERTLVIFGTPMLVCSRCAGIYAGVAIGVLLPPFEFLRRYGHLIIWATFFAMLTDVLLQTFVFQAVNHSLRISSGFFAGISASAYLISSLKT